MNLYEAHIEETQGDKILKFYGQFHSDDSASARATALAAATALWGTAPIDPYVSIYLLSPA